MVWLYREEILEFYLLTADRVTLGDDVIRRAQRGESAAWRTLIVAYQRDVFRLLALLLDTTKLADLDAMALATLSSILRDLAGLAPLASPRLSTWVYISAARRALVTLQKSDSSFTEAANLTNGRVVAILQSFAGLSDFDIARVLGIAVDEIPHGALRPAVDALDLDIPADFAERVIAARCAELEAAQASRDAAQSDLDGKRAQHKLVVRAAAVVSVACIVALVLALVRTPSLAIKLQGSALPTARQTLSIGTRAIVVAEVGASLHWRIEADGASVVQDSGDVFYRVERVGQFTIHTPLGNIRADGACLRVAIDPQGAIITVAQGRATIAADGNMAGRTTTTIAAGQRATVRASVGPIVTDTSDTVLR